MRRIEIGKDPHSSPFARHFGADDKYKLPSDLDDRKLIERHVERIVVKAQAIEILLSGEMEQSEGPTQNNVRATKAEYPLSLMLSVAWSPAAFSEVKGILYAPAQRLALNDALLTAIAKARSWIDGLVEGRITSFAEIAQQEGKVERHIRLLCPLAFVSPRIIAAILDGSAPHDLNVTGLAQPLAHSWNRQESRIGLPKD